MQHRQLNLLQQVSTPDLVILSIVSVVGISTVLTSICACRKQQHKGVEIIKHPLWRQWIAGMFMHTMMMLGAAI